MVTSNLRRLAPPDGGTSPERRSEVCEEGSKAEKKFVLECVQRPGEVLYLPSQYHQESCVLGGGRGKLSIAVSYTGALEDGTSPVDLAALAGVVSFPGTAPSPLL